MKNLTRLLALAFLVFLSSCEDNKTEDPGMNMGNLYISKSKPKPGDEIIIKYSKADADIVEGTVNLINSEKYYPVDLELEDSAGIWEGKYTIPDSIKTIAFNFKIDDKYESNGKKGYVLSLYNEDGKKLAGSQAIMGNYYSRYGDSFDIELEKDSAVALMEKDLTEYPHIREEFDVQYTNALLGTNVKKGNTYLEERIKYYTEKDSMDADNYQSLARLYDMKKERSKSDSVSKIAIEKFPKSYLAKRDLMLKVVRSPELEEQIQHFNTYEKQIGTAGYEKDIMLRYIANKAAVQEKWEIFKEYASMIESPVAEASVYNGVAWDLAEKGENLDFASEISKKSLDIVKDPNTILRKDEMYSKKQFKSSLEFRHAMYADTYALVKYKQGDIETAIEIQREAVSDKSSADANTRFVKFLTEAGKYQEAIENASNFIKENRASAEMEAYLKTAYTKTNPDKDFESYFNSLQEEAIANQREELKENMLDEKAPSFKLKDLDGNEIALADLKGKTVILDFWATWCGPCKMSFPGMQKAVEKYADNEDVEFFFVNTWESGDNRKQDVSNFIKDNKYSFHVLMDRPVAEGSREFSVVSDYGINGIPTKIIIDPEGNINFKSVGYDGNNAKLLQEIGLMIELTQNKKQPEA